MELFKISYFRMFYLMYNETSIHRRTLIFLICFSVTNSSLIKDDQSLLNYCKSLKCKQVCNNCLWMLGYVDTNCSICLSKKDCLPHYPSKEISSDCSRHGETDPIIPEHGIIFKKSCGNEQDVETHHNKIMQKEYLLNRTFIKTTFPNPIIKMYSILNMSIKPSSMTYNLSEKAEVNSMKKTVSLSYFKPTDLVILLFLWSDIFFNYIGSQNISTKLTLQSTSSRIVDRRVGVAIDRLEQSFDSIEQIVSSSMVYKLTETMMSTKNMFLWFKVDRSYSFHNFSGVFKRHDSFFKISSSLQEHLVKKPGLISIHFMTSKHLLRFSYNKFVSVNQLMFLSIKKEHRQFKNLKFPVDLFFKYSIDIKSELYFKGIAHHIPKKYEPTLDKDKLVSVYRLKPFHFSGSGKICIKFYNLTLDRFKVLLTKNIRPNWKAMNLHSTIVSENSPLYEVSLENQTKDSINYLGIISANPNSGTSSKYKFEVRYFQCYSKFGIDWKSDGCKVGKETNETVIHCQCWHLSLFGGGVAISPKQMDFKNDLILLYLVKDNPKACILVVSIILIYLMVLIWTRHNDSKDRLQRFVVVLDDNFPGEEWPYLLTVYTSFWIGSGTEANVGVRLFGTKGISRIHILKSFGQRKVLKSNCDDWFLIFTHKYLGEIEKIHIFSDYSGPNADWNCGKIMLYDLEGQKEFKFIIERWVSLAEEDECVDFICYPTSTKKSLRRDRIAMDNILFGMRETHLLFSIFTRHPRSSVTRSQRLSICVCILLVHLLTSIMFHRTHTSEVPQYSDTKRKIVIQMESTLLAAPFTFLVIFCFKKSRIVTAPKNDVPMTLTSTQAVPLETGLEINQKKTEVSKLSETLHDNIKQPRTKEPLTNLHSNLSSHTVQSGKGESEDDWSEEATDEEEEEEEVVEEEEEKEVEDGCLLNCYKQINALLFQVIISKTVMPVKIAEEDEESFRIRRKWMYFAWLLCELAIFFSAFFVIIYALKMEEEVMTEWMFSSIKYSFSNIFFMAPLKITVFALILAGLYGQLNYIASYECNTQAAVKRELYGKKKFLSRLLKMRRNKCYKPLNSKEIKRIRLKKKNWRRWRIFINFCVVMVLYLVLIVEVKLTWLGLYVQTRDHYRNMFDPRHSPHLIKNFTSYQEYLTKVVIPVYTKSSWYNNQTLFTDSIWKQEMGFFKDYSTRIIGVPSLRQHRVKPNSCTVSALMAKLISKQCYAPITWSNTDKRDYSENWTRLENSDEDSDSPWEFSNPKNSPLLVCSYETTKCYVAGGYIYKLSYIQQPSEDKVKELVTDKWFDSLTRAVFFEIVAYNVNCRFISYIVSVMEKLADGSVHVHIKSEVLHPKSDDFFLTILIMFIFVFYYFVRIILLFNRKGLKYLFSWIGILDIFLSILLYATIISLFLYKDDRTEYLYNWQLQEEKDLQITTNIFLHRDLIRYETAIMVIVIPMQVFHNFRFGKRVFNCFTTLLYCLKFNIGIAFVILIFYISFWMVSIINNTRTIHCLFNRCYNSISYCTEAYVLSSNLGGFTLLFWYSVNIITFIACVANVHGFKWMKEQNRFASDFNIVSFIFEKLRQARKRSYQNKYINRLKRKITGIIPQRFRAGADTVLEEEDMFPRNKPLRYTQELCNEVNMKFDAILEKLKELEQSF